MKTNKILIVTALISSVSLIETSLRMKQPAKPAPKTTASSTTGGFTPPPSSGGIPTGGGMPTGGSGLHMGHDAAHWYNEYQTREQERDQARNDLNNERASHAADVQKLTQERDTARAQAAAAKGAGGLNLQGQYAADNSAIAGAAQLKINQWTASTGEQPDLAKGQTLLADSHLQESHMLGRLGQSQKKQKRGWFSRRHKNEYTY